MWGWLTALIQGLVQPLLSSYNDYRRGQAAQQQADTQATLDTERKIHDALDADRRDRQPVDLDLVRREIERRQAARDRSPKGQ